MADVYARDDDQPRRGATADALVVVVADADPDALARIAAVARLGNVAPAAGAFVTRDDGTMEIRLELHGVPPATIEYLRRKLEQLSTVHRAETHPIAESGGG